MSQNFTPLAIPLCVFILTLGMVIGSFLNVLIPRLHSGTKGILTGRSRCDMCKKILSPCELIPILSFLIQKGRCRHCKSKIPIEVPIVEIISAVSFLGLFFTSHDLSHFLVIAPLLFTILFIFFYDLKFKEIHDTVMIPSIIYAIMILPLTNDFTDGAISAFYGALFATSFFFLQWFISKGRWLGSGDIRIGCFMGLILGLEKTILALILSYILGSIIGFILIIFKIAGPKSAIPLGPFLVLGTVIVWLFSEEILALYWSYL